MHPKFFAVLIAFVLTFSISSMADVTHWRVVKGAYYFQSADNTPDATTTNWGIFSIVETDLPGDAASVVMTGGNIAGSMSFDLEDSEWELGADYTSKAALDAVFPAGAYSIILSGGTLGTVTQQFSIAADAYPDTPYLTGADYSDCLALEALEPFELNWNDSGILFGAVSLQLSTGAELDEGDTVFEIYSNSFNSIVLPWNLFVANSNYNGFIDFANADLQSGIGGFGIDGDVSFNTSLAFHLDSVSTAIESDDFNGGTNSSWVSFLTEAGKQFTPTNDVLEFTTGTGPDGDSTAWTYDTDVLSYTQDWSVAVNIANFIDESSLTVGQEAYFTLLVGSDDLNYLMLLENYIEQDYSEILFGVDTNGVEDVLNISVETSAQQMALKISYDATRELLTSAYSFGGDYVVITNFSTADWGIADSESFFTALSFGTDSLAIAPGEVYSDNFRIYGESPVSNEVSLIELEYNRDYEFPDTPVSGRKNWYKLDFETSHRVETISVLTARGDAVTVTGNEDIPTGLEWYFEETESISTPWDPANDGDWTITVGYNNGTFQSTVVPFTQADGTTPIPVMNNQPLFTNLPSSGLITNATSVLLQWNTPDVGANHVGIDEWPNEDDQDILFFADSLLDDIGAVPTVHGPLSITATNIALHSGTNWLLLVNGWGRTAYNDDGIGYIVVKLSESDYIINVTDDIDGDSMDDTWENDFFGGTNVVDGGANDDFDGDGFSNLEEFIAGINPTNEGSIFGVEEPGPSPAGFVIQWNSVPGRKYRVYWAKTLSDGFDNVTPGYLPYPQNSYTDTVHTVEGCGFYYIDVQLDN